MNIIAMSGWLTMLGCRLENVDDAKGGDIEK
jgi:hypothetical protein